MILPKEKRSCVIQAMLDAHPYEKPAYHLSENNAIIEKIGFGKLVSFQKNSKRICKVIKEHIWQYCNPL